MATPTVETLQSQLHSARKSLLFMETQHAATLKGLHAEIQSLQKKCSELTFEAAMQSEKSESDKVSADMIEQMKEDIGELTRGKVAMLQLLEEKDRQFVGLEREVISQEKKYLNELKVKNHHISALNSELEVRSNTIGYLTMQLHQAKSKLLSLAQNKQSSVAPTPPSKPKSSSSHFHRTSKSVDVNFRPLSSDSKAAVSRAAKVSSNSRPSSASCVPAIKSDQPRRSLRKSGVYFNPSPMPDPAPFLTAAESSNVLPLVRPPSVLPPIEKRPEASNNDANGNPAFSVTSYPVFQTRDGKHERFSRAESFAVRKYDSSSPDQKVKGGSTTTPIGDGTIL